MGIKLLHTFIKRNCSPALIKSVHLSELANRSLVIDISIYLYRFKANETLIPDMKRFVLLLQKYDIEAIFVFDPMPAAVKMATVKARSVAKKADLAIYANLQTNLAAIKNEPDNLESAAEMRAKLAVIKPRIARVTDAERIEIREMFDEMEVAYITPPQEADMFCAYLAKINRVWGVVSNDTDMFVYGCENVIMDIDLDLETGVVYNTPSIISNLRMEFNEFRDIAVVSGTEYSSNEFTTLPRTVNLFYIYKNALTANKTQEPTFYEWLVANTNYIADIDKLKSVRNMYDVNLSPHLTKFKYMAMSFGEDTDDNTIASSTNDEL